VSGPGGACAGLVGVVVPLSGLMSSSHRAVTFLGVRIPKVGRIGVTDRYSFPIVGRGERARARHVPRPQV
jgi:hypothetical protein